MTTMNDNQPVALYVARDGTIQTETLGERKKQMVDEATTSLFYMVRDTFADVEEGRSNTPERFDLIRDCIEPMKNSGSFHKAFDEVSRLKSLGYVAQRLDVGDKDDFLDILDIVSETTADSKHVRRVVDAAPNIYLYTELVKMTKKLIQEDYTELSARRVFPARRLNTWFSTWNYERIVELDHGFPQYMDPERVPSPSGRQSEKRTPVLRQLAFFERAASWTFVELQRYAEAAAANGAPRYSIDTSRMARQRRALLHWENALVFFGDTTMNIRGILSAQGDPTDQYNPGTGIPRQAAATKFGAGTDAESDRRLLVDFVAERISVTEKLLQPNFVGLPTKAWLWINKTRYGSVAADNNQTVAQAALASLAPMGVTSFEWVPELGYRQAERDRLVSKGMAPAQANILAGGISQTDVMLVMRRDAEVGEMIVGKDITPFPGQEEIRGSVEMRMLLSSGGFEAYKPEGIQLVTDIGPDQLFETP